jgi:transposase, IS30 family
MERYTRTTREDRERILVLKQQGYTQEYIAKETGKSQPTISRELQKGRDGIAYNAMLAQRITDKRVLTRVPEVKINEATWRVINNHLGIRWAPRQIAEFLQDEENDGTIIPVCEKTIYNYINFHMKGSVTRIRLGKRVPVKTRTF